MPLASILPLGCARLPAGNAQHISSPLVQPYDVRLGRLSFAAQTRLLRTALCVVVCICCLNFCKSARCAHGAFG